LFGENNFIATLIWDKNHSAQAGIYKVYHEYVLLYAKDKQKISSPKSLSNELFAAGAMKKESGRHSVQPFTFPKGTRFDAPHGTELSGTWGDVENVSVVKGRLISDNGFTSESVTLEAAYTQVDQMRAYFYGDRENLHDSRGQKIVEFFLNSSGKVKVVKERGVETPQTTLKFGSQGSATSSLTELFGTNSSPFDAPKPISMIEDFIARFTSDGDIILDFFGGSSTTAHSTLNINMKLQSNRKFIIVQLPENLDEALSFASKDGKKAIQTAIEYLDSKRFPRKLTEIGKERIRLAGELVKEQLTEAWNAADFEERQQMKNPDELDIGFKVFKLDSTNLIKWNPDYDNLESSLLSYVDNLEEGRSEEDLLYEIMLKMGADLTWPISSHAVGKQTIYSVGLGALMVCLSEHITTEVADAMVRLKEELQPETWKVVFRDGGFTGDMEKTNIKETLKCAGLADDAFITL
jgi:adenine-specific DNA-methyltransferase